MGSVKLTFAVLKNLVLSEESHHKAEVFKGTKVGLAFFLMGDGTLLTIGL